ncbi:MAG: YmdB family metallophosphoesterase [Oscillospiraceae bacterium]|nr:YmdB family metallophosphoesterase [Oscillospiraceae bacterium]
MVILAIGDICGQSGLDMAERHIKPLKKLYGAHLCIVNAENAAILGVLPKQADALLEAGADVITLGNHTFHKRELAKEIDSRPNVIRPLNFAGAPPGQGWRLTVSPAGRSVCVVNLTGRCMMNDVSSENPFWSVERLFERVKADLYVVDFHAEATSEKLAMAYHLDGRVCALFGTHTHVPTADECVMPGGTGYITDLGMTGPICSVIGIKPEQAVGNYMGAPYLGGRFETPDGPCKLQGALFKIDEWTGRCEEVRRVDIRD